MKNIYIVSGKNHSAILFSKEMVDRYKEIYHDTKIEITNNLCDAYYKARPCPCNTLKVYAVKIGRVKGLFFTHKQFTKMTNGVSGYIGKYCRDVCAGYTFLYGTKVPKNLLPEGEVEFEFADAEVIYTDGSYNYQENLMGVGYEIYSKKGLLSHSSYIKPDTKCSSSTAELVSVMLAVDRAILEGIPKIIIYHDCMTVKNYAEKEPKKCVFGKKYYNFIQKTKPKICISFKKVKGHSGDTGNSRIDKIVYCGNVDKIIKML